MEQYLEKLLSQIHYKKAKTAIYKELKQHMECQIEENMLRGMSREEAEENAVNDMGDPFEVGSSLDKIHRPRFPYRQLCCVLAVFFVGLLLWQGYLCYHPDAELRKPQLENDDAQWRVDFFTYALNPRGWFPYAKKFDENAKIFMDRVGAQNVVIRDNYVAPSHIEASVVVEDGKTTVIYSGEATTKEGELVDYYEELIFAFELYFENTL